MTHAPRHGALRGTIEGQRPLGARLTRRPSVSDWSQAPTSHVNVVGPDSRHTTATSPRRVSPTISLRGRVAFRTGDRNFSTWRSTHSGVHWTTKVESPCSEYALVDEPYSLLQFDVNVSWVM